MMRSYLTVRANGRNRARPRSLSCDKTRRRQLAKRVKEESNVTLDLTGQLALGRQRFGEFAGCAGREGGTFQSWNSLAEVDR